MMGFTFQSKDHAEKYPFPPKNPYKYNFSIKDSTSCLIERLFLTKGLYHDIFLKVDHELFDFFCS